MNKRILFLVAVALASIVILSACATPTQAPPAPTTAPAAPQPAAFNWKMRQGEKLRVAMVTQPWTQFVDKEVWFIGNCRDTRHI